MIDERSHLRGRQPHDAVADRRPAKRPFLKALPIQNQARPSQAKIFNRSARFERKTKIVPENGSR